MSNAERHPYIDPDVKYVGVSKLRGLNAAKLRETKETLVFQEDEDRLAVLLTYDKYMAMQEELLSVARTVEMLSDAAEMEAFRAAIEDMRAGRTHSLDDIDAELASVRPRTTTSSRSAVSARRKASDE